MPAHGPLSRARRNLTGIVSALVTGLWLGALVTGQDWWLGAMLVGYVVVVPLAGILFEDDEEHVPSDPVGSPAEERSVDADVEDAEDDPLATLRDRYARGELTDEQFERKVERLLETETLEDVEDARRERDPERD